MLLSYISERFPEIEFDETNETLISFVDFRGLVKAMNLLGITDDNRKTYVNLPYKPHIAYTAQVRVTMRDRDINIRSATYVVTYGSNTYSCSSPLEAENTLETFKSL